MANSERIVGKSKNGGAKAIIGWDVDGVLAQNGILFRS